MIEPWLREDALRVAHATSGLPAGTRTLFILLVLGGSLQTPLVRRVLGASLTEELLEIGVLREDGERLATDSYTVVPRDGLYFLADRPNDSDRSLFRVYVGDDSYRLLNALDRSRSGIGVLDIGSGTGILGQSLALLAARVIAVDTDDAAVAVSRANAALNSVEDRWEVRQGDLWEPVRGEHFDLIISNPPCLPVPLDDCYPAYADGGEDGTALIRRILGGLAEHLREGGRAQMVFVSPGSGREPVALPVIRDFAEQHPEWSFRIVVDERAAILEPWTRSFAVTAAHEAGARDSAHVDAIEERLRDALAERGFAFNYHVMLHIDKHPASPGLRVLRTHNPWQAGDVPRPVSGLEVDDAELLTVAAGSTDAQLVVDAIDLDLLARFDGSSTVEEAARAVAERCTAASPGSVHARALFLCRELEFHGLLKSGGERAEELLRRVFRRERR